MKKLDVRVQNEEVLYANETNARLDKETIDALKSLALANKRRRVRICSHHDTENSLHEMVIVHTKGTYVQPHKHPGKSESFHLIEGALQLIVFDDHGEITDVVDMKPYETGGIFYHRLSESSFHSVRFLSDFAVFHEITNGPFVDGETVSASWAPREDDLEAQPAFMRRFEAKLAAWES